MFRFAAVFLASAVLTWASARTGAAADTPDIDKDELKTAVVKYAGEKKEAAVKALAKAKDTIELAKLKAADGLAYTPTKGKDKGSFKWVVPVQKDKKLDAADKTVVKDFLVGAVKAYATDKMLMKADADALEALAEAAEITAAGGGGAAVGPSPTTPGKLALKDLKEKQVRTTVEEYLKKKSGKLDGLDNMAYLKAVKQAKYLTYAPDKTAFGWKYEPADATLDPKDTARLETALKDILGEALAWEPDDDARLDEAGLKAAQAAAKDAKIEALAYSKLPVLTAQNIQSWVKDYAKATPQPQPVKDLESVLDLVEETVGLQYNADTDPPKLSWEYVAKFGNTMPPAEVKEKLIAVLTESTKAAYAEKKYPADDLPKLEKIIKDGNYYPFTKAGIEDIKLVTEPVVQKMLRGYLESSRNAKRLQDEGVRAVEEGDKAALVGGLKYDPAEYTFSWVYRPVKARKDLAEPDLAKIKDTLRKTLAEVVRTGGGDAKLTPNSGVFDTYLKSTLPEAKVEPKFEFALTDLDTPIIHQMITKHISERGREARLLVPYVKVYNLPTLEALRYDNKTKKFGEIKLGVSDELMAAKKDLNVDDVKMVKEQVKKLILKALTEPVDPTLQLTGDDLKTLTDAVNEATVTVLKVQDSVDQEHLIEEEREHRELRAALRDHTERLDALERDLQALRTRVEQGGNSTPSSPGYTIRYVQQRTGPLGCRTVMVPVVVPIGQ